MPVCVGRVCNGAERPAAAFGRNKATATGLQPRCRRCIASERRLGSISHSAGGLAAAAVLEALVEQLIAARQVMRKAGRDEIATGIDVALYRVRELQRREQLPTTADRDIDPDLRAGAALVRAAFAARRADRDRDGEAPGQSL